MGLQPLEFSDCLTDSPYFRENVHKHEKELERTSKAIKSLINEVKEMLNAARNLSKAQRNFSHTLMDFKFDCIGVEQTDDEVVIANALKEFGRLISAIEDERDRMLERAYDQFIHPLENFRKEQIGGAKEGKKKFDKQTAKFCQSLERYLNMKTKTNDNTLQEADAALEMERRHFYQASMQYVLLLQEVQERKKFEFVETLLGLVYGWLTFYHQGHEVAKDFKPYMTDLQHKLQKCRENFDTTHDEAEQLMNKMLEVRGTKPQEQPNFSRTCTREGYLYLMEKKALGTNWTKYYCQYQKENKILTMIPYNQVAGKGISTETFVLTSCTRRATDTIEKRFCYDITVQDRRDPLTLQALSEEDRRLWLDAMDGKEPIYSAPTNVNELDSLLDDIGFNFINKCIRAIEARGLDDQGLYRVVGVNSKVQKLTILGLDKKKTDKVDLSDVQEWEVKTVTSALKNYFRNLPEPLMTFKLHHKFIAATKQESKTLRVNDIHELVHQLPEPNFEMLNLLIKHLKKVAANSQVNLMNVSNLGVCFGPTLMRPKEETLAAIMDIKFCNTVAEILIEHYDKIFKTAPKGVDITQTRVVNMNSNSNTNKPPKANRPSVPPPKPNLNAVTDNSVGHRRDSGSSLPSSGPTLSQSVSSSSAGSQSTYANMSQSMPSTGVNNDPGGQTYAQYRAKLRPVGGIYSQFSPESSPPGGVPLSRGDHHSSTSSSSESLNSKCSSSNQSNPSINANSAGPPSHGPGHGERRNTAPVYSNLHTGYLSSPEIIQLEQSPRVCRASEVGNRFSQVPATSGPPRPDHGSSSTSSVSSISSGPNSGQSRRKVRTLYACEAENDSELSFEPNQIIQNVKSSREPGWLEGTLDGKTGLIPANYVEYLN